MNAGGTKIAVVGAGHVGATFAYTLPASGLVAEIVVIDANRDRAEGEAMDIADAVPFYSPVTVTSGSLSDAAGAAVTVIAADVAQGRARAARVRDAAYEIIRRKGATNFAIAAALTRIVEAIVRDEASVLTVSALVDGHYGIEDVCLSCRRSSIAPGSGVCCRSHSPKTKSSGSVRQRRLCAPPSQPRRSKAIGPPCWSPMHSV